MITIEQIKKNLSEALKQSGKTQKEIAEKVKVCQQVVSCYINGTKLPALDTFANLCNELDIDANEILCVK